MKAIFMITIILFGNALDGFSESRRVRGKVFDAQSGDPLPFAHVIFENIGVTTNTDGNFTINIEVVDVVDVPKLLIKYIGYESVNFEIINWVENINIGLIPSTETLDEVFVITAETVVRNLNSHRQINYEFEDLLLSAFYKESLVVKKQLAYIAEGVFDIYLPTIYNNDQIEIGLKKTRKKTFVNLDSISMLFVTGHARDMINGSMRRNHSFLDTKEMKNYQYWKEGVEQYDGEEVYVVGFGPSGKKASANGLLYISTSTYALIRAEYYPIISRQHFWNKVKWVEEYIEVKSTWLLKQVIYEGAWSVTGNEYNFQAILDVTSFTPVDKKPPITDVINENAIFFDSADNLDENFWRNHNYMSLSEKERLEMSESD
ncbi:CarboxypepD_reg-like domain-containing protein [Reichenbachiella faecimaris]|uniref:CarboxypepD_reg-like domain-containing protein n=1 Tax=Reichenbachiella faecimaris TaxID=692418 RepID=A0A1W2G846_REIFA|nr:carboxypeptidase-like regulatory domain-containing protein [Reichenbachiella faecimaris]SMD32860.1 CarboxypepD_reg-like domain-containing protein [Reichenbachiella faecimaris]